MINKSNPTSKTKTNGNALHAIRFNFDHVHIFFGVFVLYLMANSHRINALNAISPPSMDQFYTTDRSRPNHNLPQVFCLFACGSPVESIHYLIYYSIHWKEKKRERKMRFFLKWKNRNILWVWNSMNSVVQFLIKFSFDSILEENKISNEACRVRSLVQFLFLAWSQLIREIEWSVLAEDE